MNFSIYFVPFNYNSQKKGIFEEIKFDFEMRIICVPCRIWSVNLMIYAKKMFSTTQVPAFQEPSSSRSFSLEAPHITPVVVKTVLN